MGQRHSSRSKSIHKPSTLPSRQVVEILYDEVTDSEDEINETNVNACCQQIRPVQSNPQYNAVIECYSSPTRDIAIGGSDSEHQKTEIADSKSNYVERQEQTFEVQESKTPHLTNDEKEFKRSQLEHRVQMEWKNQRQRLLTGPTGSPTNWSHRPVYESGDHISSTASEEDNSYCTGSENEDDSCERRGILQSCAIRKVSSKRTVQHLSKSLQMTDMFLTAIQEQPIRPLTVSPSRTRTMMEPFSNTILPRCSLSVAASTPVIPRGNVEKLTLLTLQSEEQFESAQLPGSMPANMDLTEITGDSFSPELYPDCFEYLQSEALVKARRRCGPACKTDYFLGGNWTNNATRRPMTAPDFAPTPPPLPTPNYKQSVQLINYQFWIPNEPWVERAFRNYRQDRRIESIGRVSDCRIRLTDRRRRSSKGFSERMVNVMGPNAAALRKCCRLFDEKFPKFYASAGLQPNLEVFFRTAKVVNSTENEIKRTLGYPPLEFSIRPRHSSTTSLKRSKRIKPPWSTSFSFTNFLSVT